MSFIFQGKYNGGKMKKAFLLTVTVILISTVVFTGCKSTSTTMETGARDYSVNLNSANGKNDFHILRTNQLEIIPQGSVVGIVSNGNGAMNMFMTAALEDKGLIVREVNLYNLLTSNQKYQTDPQADYSFVNSLVADSGELMDLLAKANGGASADMGDETAAEKTAALKFLIEKLYDHDSILVESQRVNHFLGLVEDLKAIIAGMNVDYILVSGPAYVELSFATKIYDSENYNLVFNNLFVGTLPEWRKVIGSPKTTEDISYEFINENEPTPYWELTYSEYIASVLEISG
jgi:hypothetical protein